MEKYIKHFNKAVEDFNKNDWKGLPYELFSACAKLLCVPCEELYILDISENGDTKIYLNRRPSGQALYSKMWHNAGSALRPSDSIVKRSEKNINAMKYVPQQVLNEEKSKITYNMLPKQKALFRILNGNEIGFSEEKILELMPRIINAGYYELEYTPRGPETAFLNVLILNKEDADLLEQNDNKQWHDVLEIYDLGIKNELIRHQVNRISEALDYVRLNINPKVPEVKKIQGEL